MFCKFYFFNIVVIRVELHLLFSSVPVAVTSTVMGFKQLLCLTL